MRDYAVSRRKRIPLVKELYGLGLSVREISHLLGKGHRTIGKDLRSIATPHTPQRPAGAEVYRAVLRRYAELDGLEAGHAHESAVWELLGTWLEVEHVISCMCAAEMAMNELAIPACPSEKTGYVHLLRQAFRSSEPETDDIRTSQRNMWRVYLAALNEGKIEPPECMNDLCHAIVQRCVCARRGDIAPIWPPEAVVEIDRVMAEALTPRENELMGFRFGLRGQDAPPDGIRTYAEVAKQFGISNTCARSRVQSAEWKLGRSTGFSVFRALLRHSQIAHLPKPPVQCPEVYLMRVDELMFSIRASACFDNNGIVYIGELIQAKESDLLNYNKNFGRKTLKEIQHVLTGLQQRTGVPLAFGTVLDPRVKANFEAAIKEDKSA